MNNMILIRGDKIAFAAMPGDFGDLEFNAFDLADLITPYGLFIPISDHGMQAIPMLNPARMFNPADVSDIFRITPGDKGVLIADVPSGVQFNRVRVTSQKLASAPLLTGKNGFAIVSAYDHLKAMMVMCVRLTDTIEKTVDLYCKYAKTSRQNTLIWTKAECKKFIKDNWTEELDAAFDVAVTRKK